MESNISINIDRMWSTLMDLAKIGPGIARNVGIKKSRGKKIVFLDIDDDINFSELNNLYKHF